MRLLTQQLAAEKAEFLDGIKVFGDDSWVLVKPDASEPHFHVYAESGSPEEAQRLIDAYRQRIETFVMERFAEADMDGIVVTDTVPIDPLRRPPNMTVLPVSGLLAETITNVFSDDSVSAIFGGENQLF